MASVALVLQTLSVVGERTVLADAVHGRHTPRHNSSDRPSTEHQEDGDVACGYRVGKRRKHERDNHRDNEPGEM